jgi:hypothetical protein
MSAIWTAAGLSAGFGLSFLAFGLLWSGAPWTYQFLIAVPFTLAGYLIRRSGHTAYPVLAGMLPVGALIVQVRDKNDSHAMPIALVCAWILAVLGGIYLAQRRKPPGAP